MTVNAYIEKFEDLMTMLKQDTPELTEEWFVKCFVNGLRHDIKHQLRPLHPESLTDAYWQAKDMEIALDYYAKKNKFATKPQNTNTLNGV